jgi:Kef-type K+ transport system membrane component KefB
MAAPRLICQVVEVRIIAGRLLKYPRNHQTIFGMAIALRVTVGVVVGWQPAV